jgi:hypothetical protein
MVNSLTTPVTFIVFNRPERTAEVFAAIRATRPSQLFVIADGPRANMEADAAKCAAARAVIAGVDWSCQVLRRFSDANIGLRRNISEGLDWVFGQVERAIILEDDCLPHPSFFPFCEKLLDRYAEDRQVAMIGGTNFDPARTAPADGASYYFSRFCNIWGWATWRRAWQLCDHEMKEWLALRQTDWLSKKCENATAENFWRRHFDDSYGRHSDSLNTWDVPWQFTCWQRDMVTIVPRNNLVTNIGFGVDSTHAKSHRAAELPTAPIQFPLQHPVTKIVNTAADRHAQENFAEGSTPWQRLYWKLRLPLPIRFVRRTLRWLGR